MIEALLIGILIGVIIATFMVTTKPDRSSRLLEEYNRKEQESVEHQHALCTESRATRSGR